MKRMILTVAAILAGATLVSSAEAQVSAETLRSISAPDSVDTPIGTLKFFDGVPTDKTVDTVYDNLDRGHVAARRRA